MWTIVIISTDLRMTAGLRAALERAGINPIVTASILTAILIIQNTRVDIVLCDSNVEGGTGIASCLAIRSEFGIRAPKMMVLDDVDSVSTRAAAMYAGARDILLKSNPISENVSAVWKRIESGTASNPADDAVVAGGTGGIPDRARLERRMKQEWDYAVRHDSPLTCILLAPDRIDAIGSCMGHDIAQRIVVQSAQAMKGMLRARDFLGWFDEHIVGALLPEVDLEEGREYAQRTIDLLKVCRFGNVDNSLRVTFSAGMSARAKVDGPMKKDMFQIALERLNGATGAGGNRVVWTDSHTQRAA